MNRQEMIHYLYEKLVNSKDWSDVRKVFSECCDWNIEHFGEEYEIFMAECEDENAVAIEDDYVVFNF